jgi:Glycosyltransferase family 87
VGFFLILWSMADVDSEFRRTQVIPALGLALACIGAASMVYYHLGLFIPRMLQVRSSIGLGNGYSFGDDFYPIWLTARDSRAGHHDLYSYQMTREIQTGLFGRPLDPRNKFDPPIDYRQYAYPAFTDLLLWPSTLLDFPSLRIVLTLMLPVLTALGIWMWLKALRWDLHPMWRAVLIVLTLGTYELLEAFFALQPGLFVGFFLAGAALAIRNNRLTLGGVLCGLTLIKPQVTSLAILYLLLWSFSDRGRARFWQGFLAATLTLTLGSLWIWPHWISEWIGVLLGYHNYALPPLITMLLGPTVPKYVASVVIVILLAVSLSIAWRNRRAVQDSLRFWFTLGLLLAITTITLLPGQAIYDHIILIPGILLVLRYRREFAAAGRIQRALLLAGATVLVWPWCSAFALLVVRGWISSEAFYAVRIFALPMRTAASLPFAVLALIAWTWKICQPKSLTS